MEPFTETPGLNIADELSRQLGVWRISKIVKQKQPISLSLLGAIFERQAESEEVQAIGNIAHTMRVFPGIFIMQQSSRGDNQDMFISLVDQANSLDHLLLLNGILKIKSILKLKGSLKIKQLSTFFNQQSSRDERKVLGRNPAALTQTIQALPSIFRMCGDFVTITVEEPSNGPGNVEELNSCTSTSANETRPISYASAVLVRNKGDEDSRSRWTVVSKIRGHLAQAGTSTISELFYFLETYGTVGERQIFGKNLESLRMNLTGLPNIFAVSGLLVDLAHQSSLVNGLDKIVNFVKAKGSCGIVQITGFIGQQGTQEERQAVGKNPQNLENAILKFRNIFTFDGERVSVKTENWKSASATVTNGFVGGNSLLPVSQPFLLNNRTRNESIGVDSGYEGSVILDRSSSPKPDLLGKPNGQIPQAPAKNQRMTTNQPSFTLIDVANNHDPSFKNFKQECFGKSNDFDRPIIGVILSDDQKWLAVSSCTDNVCLLDLEACSTAGDQNRGVCQVVKDVLESCNVVKIVYDCRQVASVLHARYGIQLSTVFDTMTAHELLTCNETTSVAELVNKYTGVTPPNQWCATIGCVSGWKVPDSGEHTSDIGLAATARVMVPHLYRRMIVRFSDESRLGEVLRLCEQIMQTCYRR